MLKWLTRNDGARVNRAKRRLKSPRGSVFTEFAIVMPIVMMACSALIEVVGFWDAQIMANHAAWTVGRIAMVRGSDGLEFSNDLSKKSKTGIAGSSMPQAIKDALASLDTAIHGANLFNNRGNIATLFLMSTCGIGYFGKSPGKTLSDGFNKLLEAGMNALTKGIPDWIKELVKIDFSIPIDVPGGGSINEILNNLISKLVNKIVQAAIEPIADALKDMLQAVFEKLFGKDGIKIDDLFNGKSAAAYHARQMFGAAQRIARAKSVAGKEVLTVTDMDSKSFLFAKEKSRSAHGRLAYPQVADKEVKSDGYMVTSAHGWPPNNNGLAMVHVEINWPYESGWLFPVVSGRAAPKVAPPLARGHSMVFPQPDIQNEHLYSEGATSFAPGDYTNNTSQAMEDIANEMKEYLKGVRFCMKYRICLESVSLKDGDFSWETLTYWKKCPELMEALGISKIPAPGNSDYGKSWKSLTGTSDQRATARSIEDRFKPSSYLNREYLYWDGAWHKRYGSSICTLRGNSGLLQWYEKEKYLTFADSTKNAFSYGLGKFKNLYNDCLKTMSKEDKEWIKKSGLTAEVVYVKMMQFADRRRVNVHNIVDWIDGHNLAAWKAQDGELRKAAEAADGSFDLLLKLVYKEIKEIDDILAGTATYAGDPEDPVLDPDDDAVVKDPEKAAESARKKWNTMKKNLRAKLAEIDTAAVELRNEWNTYRNKVTSFVSDRRKCVAEYFVVGCMNTLVKTRNAAILDGNNFKFPAGYFPYDIGKGTRDMLDYVKNRYQKAVNKSYLLEVDYGVLLGLSSAGEAKRKGLTPDQMIDSGDLPDDDSPGSLTPGSDTGDNLIDKDKQEYDGRKWNWK